MQQWSTAMIRDHQPGEVVFKSILSEDIDWKPFPAFPPPARLARTCGRPGSSRALPHPGQGALWRETHAP